MGCVVFQQKPTRGRDGPPTADQYFTDSHQRVRTAQCVGGGPLCSAERRDVSSRTAASARAQPADTATHSGRATGQARVRGTFTGAFSTTV